MKLVVISDIHLGNVAENESTVVPAQPMDKQEFEKFAAEVHAQKPDVLLCLGDCGETVLWDTHLTTFFEMYKNPHGVSLCIPGNHDLWLCRPLRMTFEEKFAAFFEEAKKHGWIGIKDEPWSQDGVYIAGGMAWYDFSFRDAKFRHINEKQFDERVFEKQAWSDYINMNMRNALPVYKRRMDEFKACLAKVPPRDQRKALVVVSHFCGFERMLTGDFPPPDWGRAFMGAVDLGKVVLDADPNLYLFGHTHRRSEEDIGNTHCVCNGSGYGVGSKRFDVFTL